MIKLLTFRQKFQTFLLTISESVSLGQTTISPLSAFSLCLLFDQSCRVLANLPRSFTFMPTNLQKTTITTTQACVNIGFLSNIYLQCDLSFHYLTFKICILLLKINKIKYIQVNAKVVECLSSPFICVGALLVFRKHLQLTRNSWKFLHRNNFPRHR